MTASTVVLTATTDAATISTTMEPKRRGRPRSNHSSPFSDWLDQQGISRDDAAIQFAISRAYIDRLARGEARPSLALAARIESESRGALPLVAWFVSGTPPPPGRRASRRPAVSARVKKRKRR
jgi:hypothetical protein